MPAPNFIFAFMVATLIGAIFHLIVGGRIARLVFFLLASWGGFLVGQMLGTVFSFTILRIGSLHIIPAAVGALIALMITYIFTSGRSRRRLTR